MAVFVAAVTTVTVAMPRAMPIMTMVAMTMAAMATIIVVPVLTMMQYRAQGNDRGHGRNDIVPVIGSGRGTDQRKRQHASRGN